MTRSQRSRLALPGAALLDPALTSLLARCGVLLAAALLFGCSSASKAPESRIDAAAPATVRGYKVGKPYLIRGVWYYPTIDYEYDEIGVASWYGPGFDGRATANGETYDMNDLTAAHRTLPLPSIVRVTNLENGRSIKLRVNDRGPFVGDRIIDVSRRAAQMLGFYTDGTARVRVEIAADESREIAAALGVPDAYATARAVAQPAAVELASAYEGQTLSSPVSDTGRALTAPAAASDVNSVAPSIQPEADRAPIEYTIASGDNNTTTPEPETDQRTREDVSPDAAPLERAPQPGETLASMAALANQPDLPDDLRSASRMYVQAGAFADADRANLARRRLSPIGPIVMSPSRIKGRDLLRVRIGPLRSDKEAERILASVTRAGFPDCRLVTE